MTDKTLKILLVVIAVNLTIQTVKDVGLFPTAYAQNYDLTNPGDQKRLGISFMNNFNEAKPITAIPAGELSEENAYKIADYYVEEQLKTRGTIAGYKIGTFANGEYDNGPVDGLSGPVTAVMFSNGIHAVSYTHMTLATILLV